jgi:hypothetical protein
MSAGESGEGTIEPEVAEEFASTFVPIWQLEDEEILRCTGTLPPPFDPFPRGAEVVPVPFAAFEADPFPNPRGDGISESPGAPVGDQLTSEPVLRSPSLEPSTLESKDASTHIGEGLEVLPWRSNRRLFFAVGGCMAILAMLTLPSSRAKRPMQSPLQAASVEEPILPESLSIAPPSPVSDPMTSSVEVPLTPSAPAPESATSTRDLHARAQKRRMSSMQLYSSGAHESASPPRSSERPHGPTAGTSQLGSDRSPHKASDDMGAARTGTDGGSGNAGTCSTSALNACGGCSTAPGVIGSACVGSDDCGGVYACAGLDVSCVECRSPGNCQQLPGQCTDGVCSYAFQPDGSSCGSGNRRAPDASAGVSCRGTLCLEGGTCDPVVGCPYGSN